MNIALGIFAGIIFILYAFYFVKIIQGKPEEFELDLMRALATWMVNRGTRARGQMWIMLAASFLLECCYFVLVFLVVKNTFLVMLTGFFAAFELFHILVLVSGTSRFFRGGLKLREVFNWRIERFSALLFYTHAMLVIIILVFFPAK